MKFKGYDEYTPIRNKIRKYNKKILLEKLIEHAAEIYQKSIKFYQPNTGVKKSNPFHSFIMQPWVVLLAIKWLLADWGNIKGIKIPDKNDLNQILNKFFDKPTPDDKRDVDPYQILRTHLFQQDWLTYDGSLTIYKLGRTKKLFLDNQIRDQINYIFNKNNINLGMEQLTEILFAIYSIFLGHPKCSISAKTFSQLNYETPVIENFFKLLGLSLEEAVVYCKNETQKHYDRQFFEQSPLKIHPFIKINPKEREWNIYYPGLIVEYITHGIYDLCKEKEKSRFCENFSKVFENYVKENIKLAKLKFLTENDLKNKGLKKQVDFILSGDKGNILIETKAIEASPIVRELPTIDTITKAYAKNIAKAFAQGFHVADQINREKITTNTKNNYLLIVTYKELYLSHSRKIWKSHIKQVIDRKYPNTNTNSIPIENIHILTLEDFDKLMTSGNTDVIIDQVNAVAKKQSKNELFAFSQHWNKTNWIPDVGMLAQLESNGYQVIERIRSKFRKD